jgi:hypothetical protein
VPQELQVGVRIAGVRCAHQVRKLFVCRHVISLQRRNLLAPDSEPLC